MNQDTNIEDTNNQYAHIVGGGDVYKRANIHTLDWDGNAWFAGKVSTQGIEKGHVTNVLEIYLEDYNPTIKRLTIDVDAGTTWADIVSDAKFNPLIDITINGETKYMRLFKIMNDEVYSLNWFAFDPDSGGRDGYFPLEAFSIEINEDGNHPFEYVSPSDQIQFQDTVVFYAASGD